MFKLTPGLSTEYAFTPQRERKEREGGCQLDLSLSPCRWSRIVEETPD